MKCVKYPVKRYPLILKEHLLRTFMLIILVYSLFTPIPVAHADEKFVNEGTYSDIEGWTNVHWCMWYDYFIRIYTKSAKEAWNIIETLQK